MTRAAGAAVACVLLAQGAPASAQNLPPIAVAAVAPEEVVAGEPATLSSEGSFDPDEAPEPLRVRWDLGDGETSTNPNPTHRFRDPGAYVVALTVDDGEATAIAFVTVTVLAVPTPDPPSATSPIALSPGDGTLWVCNPDSGSVSVLDLDAGPPALRAEIRVGPRPRTLAPSRDGARVWVTLQAADEIAVIDAGSRALVRWARVGHEPYGVLELPSPSAARLLVTNQGDDTVSLLSADDLEVQVTLNVADGPRAAAVTADGGRAFVTHYLTRGDQATVTEIDLVADEVSAVLTLAEDPGPDTPSSGRGVPNLLGAVAIDPAGLRAWVGGLKSNSGRGLALTGEELTPENTVRGLAAPIAIDGGLDVLGERIDTNDADSVTAIAFTPRGRYALLAHQGTGQVSVYDLPAAGRVGRGDGAAVPFVARLEVGDAPQGIAVTSDGRRAFVTSMLSRAIVEIDLDDARAPRLAATVPVTEEPLPAAVANGKRLFHRSAAPVHSRSGYIACASCHADGGGLDGRTWDFTQKGEGLRNTMDLRGHAGLGQGPLHWSANFDEVQDFENDIVFAFGGTGLAQDGAPPNPPLGRPNAGRSRDLDDLAAYVTSLDRAPPSPLRLPGGARTEAAERGRASFRRLGCPRCHAAPSFTDSALPAGSVLHDTGTLTPASGRRLGETLRGLDTPSLLGLWDSAPYLHDGSAPTVRDVFRATGSLEAHLTRELSEGELDDLALYLSTLDESDRVVAPRATVSGGGCSSGAGATPKDPRSLAILAATLPLAVVLSRRGPASGRSRKR